MTKIITSSPSPLRRMETRNAIFSCKLNMKPWLAKKIRKLAKLQGEYLSELLMDSICDSILCKVLLSVFQYFRYHSLVELFCPFHLRIEGRMGSRICWFHYPII
ncbi:unnamed protein product [Moneuplotes crassus]|uniref:Uncharacterized protein n=1 Tax=Euplotes crassus TaxID=5936 RepID=A0AAD1UAJ6_EUPCR|nr:unnamed protein product [Moneuplotes crassus]